MSKIFRDLKIGNYIFLVGHPELITKESIVESFRLFRVETMIETLDGKRNPLLCLGGKFIDTTSGERADEYVSFFTAGSTELIDGRISKIRIDKWSEIYEKTVSEYRVFLCFSSVAAGLEFLKNRLETYLTDIKESEELNNEAEKQQ